MSFSYVGLVECILVGMCEGELLDLLCNWISVREVLDLFCDRNL